MKETKLIAILAVAFMLAAIVLVCGCTENKTVSSTATPIPTVEATPVPTQVPITPVPTENPLAAIEAKWPGFYNYNIQNGIATYESATDSEEGAPAISLHVESAVVDGSNVIMTFSYTNPTGSPLYVTEAHVTYRPVDPKNTISAKTEKFDLPALESESHVLVKKSFSLKDYYGIRVSVTCMSGSERVYGITGYARQV